LEFNVPFQHKYGYIRDDAMLHTTVVHNDTSAHTHTTSSYLSVGLGLVFVHRVRQ